MILKSDRFDESLFNDSLFDANRMSVTNGNLNYIGVLEEMTDRHIHPFTIKVDGTTINLPHALFSLIKVDNILLNPRFVHPLEHEQTYDIEQDLFQRRTVYQLANAKVTIMSERFVDQQTQNVYSKYQFKTNNSIAIELYHGMNDRIDGLDISSESIEAKLSEIKVTANDPKLNTVLKYEKNFKHMNHHESDKTVEHYKIKTEKNRLYTIYKYIGIGQGIDELSSKMYQGYEALKKMHINYQKKMIDKYRITIVSNGKAQTLIDFAQRHLHIHQGQLPESNIDPLAVFFVAYSYLHHQPQRARNLIANEFNKLEEAKTYAQSIGYEGAFYRKGNNEYEPGCEQILTGAMLIYTLDYYIQFTDDEKIINQKILDALYNISLFYAKYATYIEEREHFAFLNVANIDGSLKHIDYHILTHFLVRNALFISKSLMRKYKYNLSKDHLSLIDNVFNNIYIPKPNIDDLFLPYKDYLKDLEDNRINLNRKKADITADQLLIFLLFEGRYSEKIVRQNVDYYHKNFTDSLANQWIKGIVPRSQISNDAIKQLNQASSLFENSLLIDEKGFDIGVCGLVYYMMVYVFAGVRKMDNYFSVDSNIPNDIRRLEFWMTYNDRLADVKIKRNSARFEWRQEA